MPSITVLIYAAQASYFRFLYYSTSGHMECKVYTTTYHCTSSRSVETLAYFVALPPPSVKPERSIFIRRSAGESGSRLDGCGTSS